MKALYYSGHPGLKKETVQKSEVAPVLANVNC